jgi:hypothetical protein
VSAAVALNLISGGALMMAGRRAATTRACAALPGGIHMSRTPLRSRHRRGTATPHGGDDDAGLGPENLSQLDDGLLNDLDRRWLPRPDPDPDPCGIKAEMGDLRGDPSNAWPSCRENVYRKSMFVGTTFPTHSLMPMSEPQAAECDLRGYEDLRPLVDANPVVQTSNQGSPKEAGHAEQSGAC